MAALDSRVPSGPKSTVSAYAGGCAPLKTRADRMVPTRRSMERKSSTLAKALDPNSTGFSGTSRGSGARTHEQRGDRSGQRTAHHRGPHPEEHLGHEADPEPG